jgi:hypothetical protein
MGLQSLEISPVGFKRGAEWITQCSVRISPAETKGALSLTVKGKAGKISLQSIQRRTLVASRVWTYATAEFSCLG